MNRIIKNMDCLLGTKELPNKFCKLILTDPPYNIAHKRSFARGKTKTVSMDFGEWDYFDTKENYLKWCDEWIKECFRILDDNGHIFIWQDRTLPLVPILEANGFELRNVIVWAKSNPVPQFQKVNFLSAMEFGVWATKKDSLRKNQTFNFINQKEMHNIEFKRIDDLNKLSNSELFEHIMNFLDDSIKEEKKNEIFINENGIQIYKSSIVMGKERTSHPTQKPLEFTKKLISLFTNKEDIVVDLFTGSGTVPEACIDTGRDFYCFEIDKNFFNLSIERIANKFEIFGS
ncbi:TPA: site-specific DNA-methyltransferase [Clostridium botulinum]|nr:site-specific DNA-methyltransferase [Clostridium botulinum]